MNLPGPPYLKGIEPEAPISSTNMGTERAETANSAATVSGYVIDSKGNHGHGWFTFSSRTIQGIAITSQ